VVVSLAIAAMAVGILADFCPRCSETGHSIAELAIDSRIEMTASRQTDLEDDSRVLPVAARVLLVVAANAPLVELSDSSLAGDDTGTGSIPVDC
jgi:hypothetical protein